MSFPVSEIALKVYLIDREFATGLMPINDDRADAILDAVVTSNILTLGGLQPRGLLLFLRCQDRANDILEGG